MENVQFQMKEDDSGMVEEILNELNQSDSNQVNESVSPDIQPPNIITAPLIHPDSSILNVQQPVKVEDNTKEKPEDTNLLQDLLQKLKKPLILFVLIAVFFNPLSRTLLNKYIPAVFQSASSLRRQLAVIILALGVTLSYTGISTLL